MSAATLYNWLNRYGAMDLTEAKELKRLRDENGRVEPLSKCDMLFSGPLES